MDEQPPISSEPADRGMELTDEDPPLAAGADFEPGAPRADVAKGSPMRRRPGDRKWLVSAGTSVAIHAAVIGAGVWAYRTYSHPEPPQLVLPVGWATAFDGSGDAGAASLLRPEPPLALEAPPESEAPSARSVLGPPPREFQPPEPATPTVTIDPAYGTGELILPGRRVDVSPPRFPTRTPLGLGSESSEPPAASGPNINPQLASAGQSTAGTGASTDGGPQGVPDGMPVPSSKNRRPAYPDVAFRQDWTGTVLIELDVGTNGRVASARLVKSSGHDVLDREALTTVQTWTFTPATSNGQPVPMTLRLPINYELDRRPR